MKIDYCYHTHTSRCGHAFGTDEDYVKAAIKAGIKELGFSDHVMLPFHSQPGIRGEYIEVENYLASINQLKEKYKDQINIYVGFECEYLPDYLDYYKYLLNNKVDYLILGQHCYLDDDHRLKWYLLNPTKETIKRYTNDLIRGMREGIFSYVAHPDLFVCESKEFDTFLKECSEQIIKIAKETKTPLEINLGHIDSYSYLSKIKLHYPCEDFWKIAKDIKPEVIIGIDAHEPNRLYDINFSIAESIISSNSLNLINRLPFKK